ncbi:MAG: hypothetical protein KG012_19500 [Deltaproteobacteria bacterium]|nr:hypothetical protein [Deltaproteobacteria bacterium]
MKIWPGKPFPLGANDDRKGTNFSIFSEVAERVELCLFDEGGNQTSIDLPEVTAFYWHDSGHRAVSKGGCRAVL